ncbi:putative RNA recognition motif domain, nucleotide-binding alpha-beta plait domain superfamily [Helianthus annuus]|nr:putative RNA recognition motif domain, nucleotide-binding alpha-beta plait domain superfamily [Helianthus annuus]
MSSNLWVGNLAAGVTDSDLKNMFEKFGGVSVETCSLLRNYAFVYLKNVEDARRVKESLNGVVLRGYPLKIDFAKPAKPCKCLWVSCIGTSISKEDLEEKFSKFGKIEEFKFQPRKKSAIIDYFKLDDAIKAFKAMRGSAIRVDYSRSQSARHILPSEGPKRNEELPSNVLCISYPPTVHVNEQMLHNALILFGEIETIESFPSRFCSFVEFRSMEEALRAKNGLQGKLFNDPRISITFSRNEPAPSPYFTGSIGPRPVALANGMPFHAPHLDVIAQRGRVIPHGVVGPIISTLPFAFLDSTIGGPDPSFVTATGDLNWRSSPSNQMLSSPSVGMNLLTKSTHGTWDGFDANQIQRAPKRLRTDGYTPIKETNNHALLNDQVFRSVSPNTRFTRSSNVDRADVNYMWRGILAKGGTPVCRARCVPIGDWIGYEMPEIVNCSARTGLDMLAKHYADAIGFDIVYFLPDSEEDFASYTEFLQYMGDRNRAGVVKFGDGTTFFLVPPSDFLETVLKVSGPARLYGIVLKFPQHADRVPPVTTTSTTSVGLSLTPELVASLASLAKVNSSGQQLSGNTVPEPVLNERQLRGKMYEHETSNLTGDFMQSNKVNGPMQVSKSWSLMLIRINGTNQRYSLQLTSSFRYSRSGQEQKQKQTANSKVASFVKVLPLLTLIFYTHTYVYMIL